MKKQPFIIAMILMLMSASVIAGSAPNIVRCGIDPVTIYPGQEFTIYADVVDADGLKDVSEVGIVYDNDLLMLLPASDYAGRFEVTYTMPEDADSGTYSLGMVATDSLQTTSTIRSFSFSIANPFTSDNVQLLTPEEGAPVSCEDTTTFKWVGPSDVDFVAYAFAFYPTDGFELLVPIPAMVEEFEVPGALWQLLPDGTYYWKVGIITEMGSEPTAWSELRSFNVECNNPNPTEILGQVIALDDINQTVTVSGWGPHGRETVVQITESTAIWGSQGEPLQYEDIQLQDRLFCTGEFSGDLFLANEIFVEREPGHPDRVSGTIGEIDPVTMMLTLDGNHGQNGISVQVTDETVIMNSSGEAITFDDLAVELQIMAVGEWQNDVFVAAEINVMGDPGPGPGPGDHVFGVISEIDASSRILYLASELDNSDLIAVQITDDTELMGMMGPIAFEEITVGMMAEAMGEWQEETFVAVMVFVHEEGPGPGPGDAVNGIITQIDPENMIVYLGRNHHDNLIAVQVTDTTIIMDAMGVMISFGDLEVEMPIIAFGEWQNDVFVAAEINVMEDPGPGPGPGDHVFGVISEIDASSRILYISSELDNSDLIAVQITDDTELIGMMGPIAFEEITVGMMAEAMGEWHEETFVAVMVFVHEEGPGPGPGDAVNGIITQIDPENMIVYLGRNHHDNLIAVQVTDTTIIMDAMGVMISFGDLEVEMPIIAFGEWQNDVFVAAEINVMEDPGPGPGPGDHVFGVISEIDASSRILYLASELDNSDLIAVQITDDTELIGMMGPIAFEEITVGMMAEAMGEWHEETFVAVMVFVHEEGPGPGPGPGDQIMGQVTAIDLNTYILTVQTGGPGCQGEEIQVQADADTIIVDEMGNQIAFGDIQLEQFVICTGEYQGDLYHANEILIFSRR